MRVSSLPQERRAEALGAEGYWLPYTSSKLGQSLDLPGEGDMGTWRKGREGKFTAQYSG